MQARYVLVCEDDEMADRAAFVELFKADKERRESAHRASAGALRWFEMDGQVCRTLAELRDSLEEGMRARSLPHLVLIDDLLPPERGGEPIPSALKAVRLVATMLGDERPKCVLHTSSPDPNHAWTFCALGGHNAVDKRRPGERMQVLWETLDGRRWQPPQRKTDITVTDALGRLVPYMQLPHWKYNARIDLPELARADVRKAEARLDTAKKRLGRALGLEPRAEPSQIVVAANAHGLVWVPLTHRHLLAEDHPEHRPAVFRHLLPPAKPQE